ncbi:glycosyltransferase family 4 protein [Fictibacillus barbaricus]|uniref:Glycosyltransferase family 4 protein n=1 Tax=Fictibacillus barbaricus TaxID=182136 RepID=A0ABS2Z9R2_9BACL|nr:glycosyltransferase family 4 protein [Fictibacillus barbaricus]MBN3544900.1 glycosyltransferase family 4 protein [Fictibacillus barbaricus]
MKKILVLNHFPTALPPTSGGTLRYFHIYENLSRFYDVTLLSQTFGNKGGLFHYSSSFREYKVAKDHFYNKIVQDLQHNELTYEFALIIQTELAKHPTLFKNHFKSLYPSSDVVIHESPFLLNYDSYIRKDHKPRVYNSHNHEFMLAEQIWKNKEARSYLPAVFDLEKNLVNNADLVFSTSAIEKKLFAAKYNVDPSKIKLAPNGIHPDGWLPRKEGANKKTLAFFIGADYPPNVEAVGYIVDHLADCCPEMDFLIAGGCCSPFSNAPCKPNVRLLGRVRHKQKIKLLAEADIAINPMFTGAGVNLKTLEYLSAGIPLFSTHCGVRGLELIDKKHYIHAEKKDFASKLNHHAGDHILLRKVAARGQNFVNEHYSWRSIVHRMKGEIDKLLF